MIRVKRKEKADRLSAEAREEELARHLLEKDNFENDIDIVTECLTIFNTYSGKMNESMDISFNLEDHQDLMDLKQYVMDLDLRL